MSYAITIRRADGRQPITLDEWAAIVRTNPALESPESGQLDGAVWKEDDRCSFAFHDGRVTIDHATQGWEKIIGEVAAQLDAVAVGDDGERYLRDGTVVGERVAPGAKVTHVSDGIGFALGCLGAVGVFAWFGLAIWLFARLGIGGWGALIGLACVAISRLRWRKELVREGLLAFGSATALAGAIAWLYALVAHRHGG